MTSPRDDHTAEKPSRPGSTATGAGRDPGVSPADIDAAAARIAGRAIRTPLLHSAPMSQRSGATVLIKAEHRQLTGSFKLRGALNKVFALPEKQATGGVVTASSGNHGIGVATAAAARGVPCTVYLPAGASPSKVDAIARLGATIVTVDGTDTALAESAAGEAARAHGLVYISPYNDRDIIAGQATIAAELLDDVATLGTGSLDAVVVAVGGGGLISGIASGLVERSPHTAV
ncbi:MAG: pyridoxal-phosphate dependent enzyme, partial [Acidimicrobiales bacterium]